MNLKMVTYEIDDTRFLVDAETNEEAIKKAVHANFNYHLLNEFDCKEDEESARDSKNYTVESINTMEELYFVCHFKNDIGIDDYETIIFAY